MTNKINGNQILIDRVIGPLIGIWFPIFSYKYQ